MLVSAGPTQEAVDPVRYLSNHSSGKMGYAIARVARRRGAAVTLVSGPTALSPPPGVTTIAIRSAREMADAMDAAFRAATVVIMTAAVADYRPRTPLTQKMKKTADRLALELERTPDILAGLARRKGRRVLVGFAAETHDLVAEARRKLRAKRLDLVVANDVTTPGAGFGSDQNAVRLLDTRGLDEAVALSDKDDVAARILDWVAGWRGPRGLPRVFPPRSVGGVKRRRVRAPAARRRSRRSSGHDA